MSTIHSHDGRVSQCAAANICADTETAGYTQDEGTLCPLVTDPNDGSVYISYDHVIYRFLKEEDLPRSSWTAIRECLEDVGTKHIYVRGAVISSALGEFPAWLFGIDWRARLYSVKELNRVLDQARHIPAGSEGIDFRSPDICTDRFNDDFDQAFIEVCTIKGLYEHAEHLEWERVRRLAPVYLISGLEKPLYSYGDLFALIEEILYDDILFAKCEQRSDGPVSYISQGLCSGGLAS